MCSIIHLGNIMACCRPSSTLFTEEGTVLGDSTGAGAGLGSPGSGRHHRKFARHQGGAPRQKDRWKRGHISDLGHSVSMFLWFLRMFRRILFAFWTCAPGRITLLKDESLKLFFSLRFGPRRPTPEPPRIMAAARLSPAMTWLPCIHSGRRSSTNGLCRDTLIH